MENKMAEKEEMNTSTRIRPRQSRQKEEGQKKPTNWRQIKYNQVNQVGQYKEKLMPRRFVAAAAELARGASVRPTLSLPTLATANYSPTATLSITPPSQNPIFKRHQHSTHLYTYNDDFQNANHQDSWRLRPASCQGRPVAALPGLHTACCYPRSYDQTTRVTTPPLLPDPTLSTTNLCLFCTWFKQHYNIVLLQTLRHLN